MTKPDFLARLESLARAHVDGVTCDETREVRSWSYRDGYLQGARDAFEEAQAELCVMSCSCAQRIQSKQAELLGDEK